MQWTVIRCYDGALPPVSELSTFEALALSGSHHSAADDEPCWIPQLAAWLADVVAHGPQNLRIVGLCFGSQVCWPMSGCTWPSHDVCSCAHAPHMLRQCAHARLQATCLA